MAELPDELWRRILEMGISVSSSISNNRLTFKDLCCFSISCRRFRRLSDDDSLWSSLLSSDFPAHPNAENNPSSSSSSSTNSYKSLYRARYEKDKARRIAAHKRAVMRIESRIDEHSRRIKELLDRRAQEADKIKAVAFELSNLHKVRQASVALNVWQPEVVREIQKQIVEQCAIPVDSRINALEMERKLCKQHIMVFEKAYKDEKQRLEASKEQLSSMMYHPLEDGSMFEQRVADCTSKRLSSVMHHPLQDCLMFEQRVDDHTLKRKKLKRAPKMRSEQSKKS